MSEYKPKRRRKGLNIPWGYFVSPLDPGIVIPDIKVLEALEHSFRMRAKYRTPIRDCTMWVHAQTGKKITPAGYLYKYRTWVKRLQVERAKELSKEIKRQDKEAAEKMKEFSVVFDDRESIFALAQNSPRKQEKGRSKTTG